MQELFSALSLWLSAHPLITGWYTAIARLLFPVLSALILVRAIRSLLRIPHTPEVWAQLSLPGGGSIPLTHWENILGRGKSADAILNYPSISRQHAALCRGEDGAWTVYDLGSKGGTAVNGTPVTEQAPVKLGDTITLGGVPLVFLPQTVGEREELEKWLKQSFYPYFYVNSTSFGEFDAFDVENYADVMGEDKVEAIRENISDYWGIHDRKSLMKTTDSLLQKGDKYTYAQTLEKLGEEALTLPEDSIYYTYKLYAPDEMCKYLGTYYAYNNIGDAGVDAWDYCRCIRLFAFGYICGYISYDEYLIHAAPLAVYLQNEYDSWETMYESYYYGYLIFAGRNKNSSSSVIYSDYRYYEIMADKTEIPFRTEER